jgi:predicted metallo-beta-lactamase superfamily hydrolase
LESIIQLAKKNKAVVIFFTPPAYYTYRENLNSDQLEKSIKAISKIAKEYNNTFYINYMYDKKFVKSDFYDADHLNEIGAKKLTKLLNNLINNIEKYGLYNSSVLDGDSAVFNLRRDLLLLSFHQ